MANLACGSACPDESDSPGGGIGACCADCPDKGGPTAAWLPCPGCDRFVTGLVRGGWPKGGHHIYSQSHCCIACERGASGGHCEDPWACAGLPGTLLRQHRLPITEAPAHYLLWEPDPNGCVAPPFPAILFLHGSVQYLYPETLWWDLRDLVTRNIAVREGFVVVAPFASAGEPLARVSDWTKLDRFGDDVPYVDGFDEVRVWAVFLGALQVLGPDRVDASRLHVVGYSMGGQAAWNLAVRYGSRLASVVPFAGRCGWHEDAWAMQEQVLTELRNLFIWCYCGEADTSAVSWRDFWWLADQRGLATVSTKCTESHVIPEQGVVEEVVHAWGANLHLSLVRSIVSCHCIWNVILHNEDAFTLFTRMCVLRCLTPVPIPLHVEDPFPAGRGVDPKS